MSKEDKIQSHNKYLELKNDYISFRQRAQNAYDFYNLVEKSVLEMEDEGQQNINENETRLNGMSSQELQKMCQQIRVLSM